MICKHFRFLVALFAVPVCGMAQSIAFEYTRNCSAYNHEDSEIVGGDVTWTGHIIIYYGGAGTSISSTVGLDQFYTSNGYNCGPSFPNVLYADTNYTSVGAYLAANGGSVGVVVVPLYGLWSWPGYYGTFSNFSPGNGEWEWFGTLTFIDGVLSGFTPGNLPKDKTISAHDEYTNQSGVPERVTWTWTDENGNVQTRSEILQPGESATFDLTGTYPAGSEPAVNRKIDTSNGEWVNPETGKKEIVWNPHHEQAVPVTEVELEPDTEREFKSTVSVVVNEKPYEKPDPDNPNNPGETNPNDPDDPSGGNLDAINDTLKSIKAEIEVLEKIGVDQLDDQQRGMFERLRQLEREAQNQLAEREAELQGPESERASFGQRIKSWGGGVLDFIDAVTTNPLTFVQNKYAEISSQITWASVLGSSPDAMQNWVVTGSAIPESFQINCGPIHKTLKIPYSTALKPFLNSVRALLVMVFAFMFLRWVYLGTLACFAGGVQVAGSSGATTVELHPSIAGVSLGALKGPIVSLVVGVALWSAVISGGWLMVAGSLEHFSFLQAVLSSPTELASVMNAFAGSGSFEVGGGSYAWGAILITFLNDTFPVGFAVSCFLTGRIVAIFAIFAPVFGVTAATTIWLKSVT